MENEFVPYAEAVALKDLGFDEPCFKGIDFEQLESMSIWGIDYNTGKDYISIPLYQQAFRWFREKHGLDHCIFRKDKDLGDFYGGYISRGRGIIPKSFGSNYKTYEESELACLRKLIEILSEN